MKPIIFIAAILCLAKISLSQNTKTRKLLLVKERTEIDSIINDFKKSNQRSVYKNDSCFLLNIVRVQSKRYNLEVSYVNNVRSTILIGNDNILDRPNLRYFKFQNNLVFVTGSLDLNNLFKPGLEEKLFKFKQLKMVPGINIKELYSVTYKYVDGKFEPNYIKATGPIPANTP